MKIGQVSQNLGIAASRIRYYENKGLLGDIPRESGQRIFSRQTVAAIEFVLLAQSAGFNIQEIRSLLDEYEQTSDPKRMWRKLATTKQTQVRSEIKELQQIDRVLDAVINCDCTSLASCVEQSKNYLNSHKTF